MSPLEMAALLVLSVPFSLGALIAFYIAGDYIAHLRARSGG